MWLLRFLSIGLLFFHHFNNRVVSDSPEEQQLERALLKTYNNKVRPVKLETTVTQVTVFLNIAHVERVDEAEQTALVHGHLWASWTDEYMTWNRTVSNITKIQVPSSRIWQPALALYNSARGNSWHLYMNGLPATVYYTGKVWSSGTFSFFVTCQFDFTNWPFDTQNCPIVIADWVYGLAQVNLSDPNTISEYAKPTIRLSYDPIDRKDKRHVGAWEVKDAWKKHCYWGPKGCKTDQPEGEADWYWSLLEFGVTLKRHLPYFGIAVVLPFILTCAITLSGFWFDTLSVNVMMVVFNVLLQGLYGMNLIEKMPPGSGGAPKIVHLYIMNIVLSSFQLLLIVGGKFIEAVMPTGWHFQLGVDITEIPKKMGVDQFFTQKGISFDPQELLNPSERIESILENGASIGIGNALDDDLRFGGDVDSSAILINLPTNSADSEENPSVATSTSSQNPVTSSADSKLRAQLKHIRRYCFLLTILIYFCALLFCLFF